MNAHNTRRASWTTSTGDLGNRVTSKANKLRALLHHPHSRDLPLPLSASQHTVVSQGLRSHTWKCKCKIEIKFQSWKYRATRNFVMHKTISLKLQTAIVCLITQFAGQTASEWKSFKLHKSCSPDFISECSCIRGSTEATAKHIVTLPFDPSIDGTRAFFYFIHCVGWNI